MLAKFLVAGGLALLAHSLEQGVKPLAPPPQEVPVVRLTEWVAVEVVGMRWEGVVQSIYINEQDNEAVIRLRDRLLEPLDPNVWGGLEID